MFKLEYKIRINNYYYNGVTSVEIKRNITSLTGTAKITLPATAVYKKSDGTKNNIMVSEIVKRGSSVEIQLGYNGQLRREFYGYVTRVNFTRPIEIECEDEVFTLKQTSIKKTYKNTTIQKVLNDIVFGTGINVDTGDLNINIDKLILATKSQSEVSKEIALNYVLDRYGLVGFFDLKGGLFVGLRQGLKVGSVKYRLGWNTIKDNELKYHNADDEKVKIKAIYVDKLGARTEIEVGDEDGSARTIFLTDVADKTQLTKLAQNELEKYKFTGFSGSITTFLQPFAEPGYIVEIEDPEFKQRDGNYYCEGIEVKFNQKGARRKIEIGAKV